MNRRRRHPKPTRQGYIVRKNTNYKIRRITETEYARWLKFDPRFDKIFKKNEELAWYCKGCGGKSQHKFHGCKFNKKNAYASGKSRMQQPVLNFAVHAGASSSASMPNVSSAAPLAPPAPPVPPSTADTSVLSINDVWNKVMTYLNALNMPSVYGMKLKKQDYNWAQKKNISSWIFPFPDPLMNTARREPLDYALYGDFYGLIDPFVFFPHVMHGVTLRCPHCGTSGGNVQRKKFLQWKIKRGDGSIIWARVLYLQHSCIDLASGVRTFPILDAVGLPDVILKRYNILHISERNVMEKSCAVRIRSSLINGTPFQTQSNINSEIVWDNRIERAIVYRLMMDNEKAASPFVTAKPAREDILTLMECFPNFGADMMRNTYVKFASSMKKYFWGYQERIKTETIKMDLTFYAASKIRDAEFAAMFDCSSDCGEILLYFFVRSKKQSAWEQELKALRDRYAGMGVQIKAVFTDNPTQDEAILKSIFGDHVQVIKDVWHVMSEIHRGLKQKDVHCGHFMGRLHHCFYNSEKTDVERVKQILRDGGSELGDLELEKLLLKGHHPMIRRFVNDAAEIKRRLQALYDEYAPSGLFNEKMHGIIVHIKNLLDKGYVRDASGVTLHYNIGTKRKPVYITISSTSQLESFHQLVRTIVRRGMNAELVDIMLADFIYRLNIRKADKTRKLSLGAYRCYDPILLNELKALYDDDISPLFGDWKAVRATDLNLGAGRIDKTSDAYKAFMDYCASSELSTESIQKSFEGKRTYLSESAGLPIAVTKVETREEELFADYLISNSKYWAPKRQKKPNNIFQFIAAEKDNYEKLDFPLMVRDWTFELTSAYLAERDITITVRDRNGKESDVTLDRDKLRLKNAEDLKEYSKRLYQKIAGSYAKGTTKRARREYDRNLAKERAPVTIANAAPLPPTLDSIVPRSALSSSSKSRRQRLECPECHWKKGHASGCPIFKYITDNGFTSLRRAHQIREYNRRDLATTSPLRTSSSSRRQSPRTRLQRKRALSDSR